MTHFAIDHDTLFVEAKHSEAKVLEQYVKDNELELAVAVVGDEDDLTLQFTVKEMQRLYRNLSDDMKRQFKDEDEAAHFVFKQLTDDEDEYPVLTPALVKKLLRAAAKRTKDTSEAKATGSKTTSKPAAKRASANGQGKSASTGTGRSKRLTDETLLTIGEKPKENTLPFKVWEVVDDNLGEMPVGEIVTACATLNEADCRKQISRSLRKGFLVMAAET